MSIENQIKQVIHEAVSEALAEALPQILDKISPSPSQQYYSVKDLAKLLGFSPGKVREWYHTGKLSGCQIDGKIIFEINEVEKFIHKHKNLVN